MVDEVMGNDLHFEIFGDWRETCVRLHTACGQLSFATLGWPCQAPACGNFGPNTAGATSRCSSAVDDLGLEIDEMLVMVETLDAFVAWTRPRGTLRGGGRPSLRYGPAGMDANPDPLHRESDRQRTVPDPQLACLRRPSPHDPDRLKHGFDLGLERVLDGLAMLLPDSSPVPGRTLRVYISDCRHQRAIW